MKNWKTDKVVLRAVRSSDLENYFLNGEQIDTESQRSGDRMTAPYGDEIMKKRVADLSNRMPSTEDNYFIIENLLGDVVGNINVHSCSMVDGTFEYGLGIRPKHRGSGYAKDAIKLVLDFYFNELRYQKCNVRVYDYNIESIRLHESLGYILEGRLRRSFYGKGQFHDIMCFGMTKEEFADLQ